MIGSPGFLFSLTAPTRPPPTSMRLLRLLIISQATYIFLTALWPLVHLESFMAVTGYKTDVWLVKTVGALLIPVAASMNTYLAARTIGHSPCSEA